MKPDNVWQCPVLEYTETRLTCFVLSPKLEELSFSHGYQEQSTLHDWRGFAGNLYSLQQSRSVSKSERAWHNPSNTTTPPHPTSKLVLSVLSTSCCVFFATSRPPQHDVPRNVVYKAKDRYKRAANGAGLCYRRQRHPEHSMEHCIESSLR